MKTYVRYDSATEEISVQNMAPNEYDVGCQFWEVPADTDPNNIYIHNDSVHICPEKPNNESYWVLDKESGAWVDLRTPEEVAESFELYRKKSIVEVNKETGKVRAKYITTIEGQEMLYLDKEREAVAFLSDPEPNMLNYPFISKEIGVTATSGQELAQIWLNSSYMWRQVAAELEKQRFQALNSINTASTYDEIESIVEEFKSDVSIF